MLYAQRAQQWKGNGIAKTLCAHCLCCPILREIMVCVGGSSNLDARCCDQQHVNIATVEKRKVSRVQDELLVIYNDTGVDGNQ
jgi:hypothetical protein